MEKATKGFTEAVLNFATERIPELVRKLGEREIAFIQNKKNIEIVKTQRASDEYKTLCQYVPKGPLPLLMQMGLALRQIEKNKDSVKDLKDKIIGKYGRSGLHIAELVQIGIATQLLSRQMRIFGNHADIQKRLTSFLEQAEELALFIKKEDIERVNRMKELVVTRVDNNPTGMVILFGSGYAKLVVLKILKKVKEDEREYPIEVQDEQYQITGFVFAPELREKLTHWSDTLSEQKRKVKRKSS